MAHQPFVEYWVDTDADGAVLRYLLYEGNVLLEELSIVYDPSSKERRLILSWRWTMMLNGKVLFFEEMSVQRVRTDPVITNEDFELSPVIRTGMLLEERQDLPTDNPLEIPKSKVAVYRIDNTGERIQIPDPVHRKGDQYGQNRPDQPERRAWFGAFLLCVGGCVTFVLVRRNKLFQFR